MYKLLFFVFLLLAFFSIKAQLVVNEGSNKNYSTLTDEDGDNPDWIEIFNSGTGTIDLYGYSLTDDVAVPTKWTFPHVTILPGAYMIIYCSGKNKGIVPPFTTVVYTGTFSPSTGWNTHLFINPLYWDGLSDIIINVCSYSSSGYITNSVFNQSATSFISTIFAFQDGSPASCLATYGYTATQRPNMKLDGIVIGTGTIQNSITTYPAPYGNWYWGARHQMLIKAVELTSAGLSAGNISSIAFDVAYTDAVTYDYIEISMRSETNSSLSSVFRPLSGIPYFHTNFKISGSGETVYLFSPAQVQLSQLFVNCHSYDTSTGLLPDASGNVTLFCPPSPGDSNNASVAYSYYAATPSFSVGSGFFTMPITVSILNPNGESSKVYYTTNGDDPGIASNLYDGTPVTIFQSTVLKARAFVEGSLPSSIKVASYFFNVYHITPIISVATDNSNLYGPSGIFDNYNYDWLKPAYVEYFDSASLHQMIFSKDAAIRIDGGAGGSRSQPQHSFRVDMGNGVLGGGAVNYPLIPDRPGRTKYSSFYLRNGSNQYLVLPHKDAAEVKMMGKGTYNYYSAWRPVSVYINGLYFGLYELREKFDEEMFCTLEDATPATIEILSLSYFYGSVLLALAGSVDSFWDSYSSFTALNPADTGFWNQADAFIDMEYYVDYIIGESWIANSDWPWNNIKLYRSDKTNYRWRFCLIDLELSLAPNGWTDCTFDHIGYMLNQDTSIPYVNIWLKGIQNKRFRNYFINRYADVMNTIYDTTRLMTIENNMFNQTVSEMQNEYQRWGDAYNVPAQINEFYNRHMTFQSQIACRTPYVRYQIMNGFSLPRQVDLILDVYPEGAGIIHISTITPAQYPWHGIYFDGLPVKIKATSNNGYHFSHWGSNVLITDPFDPVFNDTLKTYYTLFKAYFEPVNSIDLLPAGPTADYMVFPSPADRFINIENRNFHNNKDCSYRIIDLNGRIVREGKLNNNSQETIVDIHSLPPALYILRINNRENLQNFRFVKI